MPSLEEDVLGLDIAMHDVLRVGVRQRFGDVAGDRQGIGEGEPALPREPMAQGLSLDIRHDVEEQSVRDARIEQRQDVGVGETGGHLDFAEEPVGPQGNAELGPQHLHGHQPVVTQVAGEVDDGHPATTNFAVDCVAVGQRGLETSAKIGHAG